LIDLRSESPPIWRAAAVSELAGKRAIVTGAGRGIGFGIAKAMARAGAQVLIVDVVADRAEAAEQKLREFGDVHAFVGDLSDPQVCDQIVETANSRFGGIDVLVNNAGIDKEVPFLEHSEEDWDRILAVNAKAMFLLTQRVARGMVDRGIQGVIISTASTNGHAAEPGRVAYNASKGAVIMFTKSIAVDLAQYGIRAVAVSPGIVETDLGYDAGIDVNWDDEATRVPLGRVGTTDEVGELYAFLASDRASYISGIAIVIDGALTAQQPRVPRDPVPVHLLG
jgi:glucose 1-dehydrogenase